MPFVGIGGATNEAKKGNYLTLVLSRLGLAEIRLAPSFECQAAQLG